MSDRHTTFVSLHHRNILTKLDTSIVLCIHGKSLSPNTIKYHLCHGTAIKERTKPFMHKRTSMYTFGDIIMMDTCVYNEGVGSLSQSGVYVQA